MGADTGAAVLVPVLANHRFDEAALGRYLDGRVPGDWSAPVVRQFQGGQSNPTFHVRAGDAVFVVRKKPKGKLLAGAHAIEREYRAQRAVGGQGLPVPEMHLLCEDTEIIGEAFYVMSHVEGRIFTDRLLTGCSPADRTAMYDAMNAMMARLHSVDVEAAGLAGFGKPADYVARQIAFWSRNYEAAKVEELPAMDRLMAWLGSHVPQSQDVTLVHGDFRLGNLVFHPTRPEIVAILDWELATLGHPLTDLAYNCLPWHVPSSTERGFSDVDVEALGIPSEAAYLARYVERTDRPDLPDWDVFVIFSIFRIAAIIAGVYKRALQGNAADGRALGLRTVFRSLAERGVELVEK